VADPEAAAEEGGSGSVNYSEENKKRAADFDPGAFFISLQLPASDRRR
jgi:hypothetical protein